MSSTADNTARLFENNVQLDNTYWYEPKQGKNSVKIDHLEVQQNKAE